MNAEQILQQAAGPNFPQVQERIAAVTHAYPNHFRMLQFGNTLFLTVFKQPGVVAVSMETADNPRGLMHAMLQYEHSLATSGIHTVIARIDNPQMERVLQMIGAQFQMQGNHAIISLRGGNVQHRQ